MALSLPLDTGSTGVSYCALGHPVIPAFAGMTIFDIVLGFGLNLSAEIITPELVYRPADSVGFPMFLV